MLNTVFYSVLNMSITASVIGLLITMLRKLKLIPGVGIYYLWSLVLLRLLIPFSVSSRVSLLNFAGSFVKRVVTVPGTEEQAISLSMTNTIGAAGSYFPVTYKTKLLESIFGTAAFIWIAGAVLAISAAAVICFMADKRFRTAIPVSGNIFTGRMVDSPLVHGFLRQRILIPEQYLEKSGLKFILLHENVHIKRHDNLVRLIAVTAACLHWFNPLAWVFLRLFIDDMELSCDISAVRGLTGLERKAYAGTLLGVGTGQDYLIQAAFGKTNVRDRVINILNYKKISAFALAVTVIFLAAASIILLTNPAR